MLTQTYWNTIGAKKEFEDPLYFEKLEPFLSPHASILEYGCGYGRLMEQFTSRGYKNIVGFDYAPAMIERGQKSFPHLDLRVVEKVGKISAPDNSIDVVLLSTVLCCLVDTQKQEELITEIWRVLKNKGVLYLSDFLISDHPRYQDKYMIGAQKFGDWGIYTTSENLTVRHHSTKAIFKLLNHFNIHWFEQFEFKTMNNNPVQTFHTIAQKYLR